MTREGTKPQERINKEEQMTTFPNDNYDPNGVNPDDINPIEKLRRDLRRAAELLTPAQARFYVDIYYEVQDFRTSAANQKRALGEGGEPNELVTWTFDQMHTFENAIKSALLVYAQKRRAGRWAMSVYGIGPVLAAGLLAYINPERAITAGHIWRFAGLDSTVEWLGKDGAKALMKEVVGNNDLTENHLQQIALRTNRKAENIRALATMPKKGKTEPQALTASTLTTALARRPWSANFKVLCWKIGESFVKFHNQPECVYGHFYAERKALEIQRNEAGLFSGQAAEALRKRDIGKDTEAYTWYSGRVTPETSRAYWQRKEAGESMPQVETVPAGQGTPMLPPGHIHARAKRYAVKIFLAHFQHVLREANGLPIVMPYVITHLGHRDYLAPPGWPCP